MRIKENYSYISDGDNKLVENGYGKISVYSFNIDRYYTEEGKLRNSKNAKSMNDEDWKIHVREVSKQFGEKFEYIRKELIKSKYDIHQIDEETKTMEHYSSDWDLYYYSNEGWNGNSYADHIKLNFNTNRSVEENLNLLKDLTKFMELINIDNIVCSIQYTFVADEKKINNKVNELCQTLEGKFIQLCNMTGKIKVVSDNGINKRYGFFKKGSRKKYYNIPETELILNY